MKNYRYLGPIIAVILPYILFEFFRKGIFPDPYFIMPNGHFYIVSTVALLSTIIAVAVGMAGKRLRNIKVSFISLSFISLALLFSLHGLSTPHFLLHVTHLPGVAAQLSMLLATFWLWLSSWHSDSKLIEKLSLYHQFLLPVWTVILVLFGMVSMLNPHMSNMVPLDARPVNLFFAITTFGLNITTMARYYQSYRYSRFPLQLAIVYSSGFLIISQYIMVKGELWRLSWWMYHYLLLASMIVMVSGLIMQYTVKGNFIGSIRALFTNDPFERVTSSISPSVKALVIATEKKDTYTAGHTFRVTMYALKLGEELKLKPEQLHAIAQGTLVHDVGKISIPDSILNKPGRLTEYERVLIEQHPLKGYHMCRDLGFMNEELSIIRSHHEKWDGSGYPDRLNGDAIPILARIVAVADVYDALTTERSYRKAWPHSKAMDFLIEQKGRHFDPVCIDAWVKLCELNPSVYQYPSLTVNEETTVTLVSKI